MICNSQRNSSQEGATVHVGSTHNKNEVQQAQRCWEAQTAKICPKAGSDPNKEKSVPPARRTRALTKCVGAHLHVAEVDGHAGVLA